MDFPRNLLQAEADVEDSGNTEAQGDVDYGLLIEAIQSHPYLYDLSHKLYKDAKRKQLVWQHISELLNCTVEACMKAWRNLRDRFVKEKKKLASGARAPETNWPYYEAMLFYGKFTKLRKAHTATKGKTRLSPAPSRPSSSSSTWSNVTYDTIMSPESVVVAEIHTDDADSGPAEADIVTPGGITTQTPTTSSGPPKKRKRAVQSPDEVGEIMGVTKNIMAQLQARTEKTINSTFAEYICGELEKLPEAEAKKKRKRILGVLFCDDSE